MRIRMGIFQDGLLDPNDRLFDPFCGLPIVFLAPQKNCAHTSFQSCLILSLHVS